MIKEKNQSKNNNKSYIFENHIEPNNKKGLFSISSDNSSLNYASLISPPYKKIEKKQKFETNFQENIFNNFFGNKNPDILSKIPHKITTPNNKKEIYMNKQKTENEFNNILSLKKGKNKEDNFINNFYGKKEEKVNEMYPIGLIIDDKFFDLLVNIYKNEGIEIEFEDENDLITENKDLKESFKINSNPQDNREDVIMNNEQISCICLKSKCLNNYCSCHKNGIICNKNCRCMNCENIDNKSFLVNDLKNNNNICKVKNSKFFSL